MRAFIPILLAAGLVAIAADEQPARKGGSRQPVQTSQCNDVPEHPFDVILGRPEAGSVTVSVLCHGDAGGFIAYGTLLRANILVDSFSNWLPRSVTQWMDAFWMLVWCLVVGVLAERLSVGAIETWRSGTTTMVLGLSTWWAVGLGALGFAAAVPAAGYWVLRFAQGRG